MIYCYRHTWYKPGFKEYVHRIRGYRGTNFVGVNTVICFRIIIRKLVKIVAIKIKWLWGRWRPSCDMWHSTTSFDFYSNTFYQFSDHYTDTNTCGVNHQPTNANSSPWRVPHPFTGTIDITEKSNSNLSFKGLLIRYSSYFLLGRNTLNSPTVSKSYTRELAITRLYLFPSGSAIRVFHFRSMRIRNGQAILRIQ